MRSERVLTRNLRDPDMVGQSEYLVLWDFLRDIEDSMEGEDPNTVRRRAVAILQEVKRWADLIASSIEAQIRT